MQLLKKYFSWMFSTVMCTTIGAQPSFQSVFMIGGQKIFRDVQNANLYYYVPPDYTLVRDAEGKPSFTLTQMRYTGTKTTGDEGKIKFSNLLQFRVTTDPEQVKVVPVMRTELRKLNGAAELRMLPVKKFSSILVFASSSDTPETEDTAGVRKIDMASATDETAAVNNSYWTDRTISLRLSDFDAQLVEAALKNRQSILSFSYAVYSVFAEKKSATIEVNPGKKWRPAARRFFTNELLNETDSMVSLVKADVVDLSADLEQWPSLIMKVDINERVPARYPLFDVYCYDFANALRADLYEKKVEIRASSVGGNTVTTSCSFKESQPDVYARQIRFAYVVRRDLPFHYRITEIDHNGEKTVTPWIKKEEWNELLDISSTPDRIVRTPGE